MVEINPRRGKPNLFLQVSVAVISGAAAMYFISNFSASPSLPKALAPKSAPKPESKDTDQPPKPETPPPAEQPSAEPEPTQYKPPPPPINSMMVVPESGGVAGGMVAVYGEDAPPPGAPAAPPAARTPQKSEEASAPKAKPIPMIHLEQRAMSNPYSGPVIGHDFTSPQLTARIYAKKPPPAPVARKTQKQAPSAAAPKAPPIESTPLIFDKKPIPQKDLFAPSILHPEIIPEEPFWDYQRKKKAVISGLVAVSGIVYLLFAMGIIQIGKRRVEEEGEVR